MNEKLLELITQKFQKFIAFVFVIISVSMSGIVIYGFILAVLFLIVRKIIFSRL